MTLLSKIQGQLMVTGAARLIDSRKCLVNKEYVHVSQRIGGLDAIIIL